MRGHEWWPQAPGGRLILQHCETKGEVVGVGEGRFITTVLPWLPWGDGPVDCPGGWWVGDCGVALPSAVQELSQKLPSGFHP